MSTALPSTAPAAARPPRRPETVPPLCGILLLALVLLPGCRGADAGKFKHTGHVTIAKGTCAGCHGDDPAAPKRPAAKECVSCHPKGARLFAELQALPGESRIVPQRPRTYADVIFSHAPHAGAGIPCGGCHVLPEGGKKESSFPPMAACKACHTANGVSVACRMCHRGKR